jgi:hypothetical protein
MRPLDDHPFTPSVLYEPVGGFGTRHDHDAGRTHREVRDAAVRREAPR